MTRRLGLVFLILVTLACNSLTPGAGSLSNRVNILNRLPTLTPTLSPPEISSTGLTEPAPEALSLPLPEQGAEAPMIDSSLTPEPGSSEPAPAGQPPPAPESAGAVPVVEPTSLPTLDPRPVQEAVSAPVADPSPAGESPTAAPAPTPGSETSGWVFSGVQLYPGPSGEGLLLYGEALNNTGSAQELSVVTTTLYDAQGQILADPDAVFGYWPVDVVPAGERLPFQLTVPDIQSAADFKLHIEAQPKSAAPYHEFEFANLDQWSEEGITCLTGQLQNPGVVLQDYVVMMAVFYNAQGQVLSFGEYYAPAVEEAQGDQPMAFEVCLESPPQEIARYELRGWGE